MTRTRTTLTWFAGFLALSVVGVAVYLAFWFDANVYKPRILAAAKHYTDRPLTIGGEVSVALLPSPHATLRRLRLDDPQLSGGAPLAEVAELALHPRLWPLLRGQLELDEIVIDGLRLHLRRAKSGENNWHDVFAAREAQQPSEQADATSEGSGWPSVRIEDAEVTLDDDRAHRYVAATAINATIGRLGSAAPAMVAVQARLDGRQPQVKANFSLRGQVLADTKADTYGLKQGQLRLEGDAAGADPTTFTIELRGDGEYNRPAGSMAAGFTLAMFDLAANGTLNAHLTSATDTAAGINGDLEIAEFNPRQLFKRLGKTVPPMRDSSALQRAQLKLGISGNAAQWLVQTAGRLDDSVLSGHITVREPLARQIIRFKLAIDRLDLDRYRSPQPKAPPSPDVRDVLAELNVDKLRELGLDLRGEIKVGELTLNGDRSPDYVVQLDWNP